MELRIQAKGRKPPVWRRLIIHPETGMEELHRLITLVFALDEGEHTFREGKDVLRPGGAGHDGRKISDFPTGTALTYRSEGADALIFNVKVISKERVRSVRLPVLTGGMRKLEQADGESPYDLDDKRIWPALRKFRRYDELVPDEGGNMVEPWRAAALTESDELREEFQRHFPGAARKGRTFTPLQPVPDKVPPGIPVDLKITLKGMPVPVWRLVRVGSDISFLGLHRIIQGAMGWEGYHLYEFSVGDSIIQQFDDDMDVAFGTEIIDAGLIRLRDLLTGKGWSIEYKYDFGDGWTHQVKAVKVHEGGTEPLHPEVLDGTGACPPEDCGGPYGYAELVRIVNDPRHPEHQEMADWLGTDKWGPNKFDIEASRKKVATAWSLF